MMESADLGQRNDAALLGWLNGARLRRILLDQGIEQMVPANRALNIDMSKPIGMTPVLGGLHADYRRAG